MLFMRVFLNSRFWLGALCLGGGISLRAADLPPDKSAVIPAEAQRQVVLLRPKETSAAVPKHALPQGYSLEVVANAPLVRHPLMGCVDDRGRLFIGDAVGVNWDKAQLEKNPPNRVLMLEDLDGDGQYDKSSVFADKMTFPQGAAWLNGSLYVCSPPGLWRLQDKDGDGVAEVREMIVGGFDYTGNAADVHGPKVHPNGRLYWCHGRKGHKVLDQKGEIIHEGKASGIWSCLPDGSDVRWHSLGCADNPTGLAITPQGEVLGTCNLYYSQPRGDTLMHWLLGGVYERADQMQVIAGLPRTLEKMPVVHDFGHVAVSGCAFGNANEGVLPLYVTHFNTQRLVRMNLTPEDASFKVSEDEFLKIEDADVHLTDVVVDHDGSLLVLNTGGWFRIGCPSSLMAKPDMLGSVYRIRGPGLTNDVSKEKLGWKPAHELKSCAEMIAQLRSKEPRAQLQALTAVAWQTERDAESLDKDPQADDLRAVLMQMMAEKLEPVLEHALLYAVRNFHWIDLEAVSEAKEPILIRRLLLTVDAQPEDSAKYNLNMGIAARHLDSADGELSSTAMRLVTAHADADEWVTSGLKKWLGEKEVSQTRLRALEGYTRVLLGKPETLGLITEMLAHDNLAVREAALRVLAGQPVAKVDAAWLPRLKPVGKVEPLLLNALKRLKNHPFDAELQTLAADMSQPLSLRLKALDAMKGSRMKPETVTLLREVLMDAGASSAARIQAAAMLGGAALSDADLKLLAPALARVGPVEMKELLAQIQRTKDVEVARLLAVELAKNPALISEQESLYRTVFSNHPPEILEEIVLPAHRKGEQLMDAKKRSLGNLAERVKKEGRAEKGKLNFEQGKGTCMACHQVGKVGRALGPDLSKIGSIRTERDLLESILFPSNTLARDYEAHVIEMRDGQSIMGVIRSHSAEGLLLLDIAGQERTVPHDQMVSDIVLKTSLMPMGLDATMSEQELLDLVAYLSVLR